MSAPKPWSNMNVAAGNNYCAHNMATSELNVNGSIPIHPAQLQSSASLPIGGYAWSQTATSQVPPPIPPRVATVGTPYRYGMGQRGYSSYGSYSNPMYSNAYSSMYRGYGGLGYNGMPYGSTYYGAGAGAGGSNELIRFAEESTRPAFQSIESVVHAVGSVNMMLESTFHALYSSYQSVLGVADQFSRLRNHLSQILSALAVLRSLQWLLHKILYLLGIRRQNPSNESVWSAASEMANSTAGNMPLGNDPPRSSWPIVIFLSVVLGAPWVILRFLAKAANARKEEVPNWPAAGDKLQATTNIAIVLYDFNAQSPHELSVRAGQRLFVAPKSKQPKVNGWLLVTADGKTVGLVPSNYIKLAKLPGRRVYTKTVGPDGKVTVIAQPQTNGLPVPLQQQATQNSDFPVTLQQQTMQTGCFSVPLQQETTQNSGFLVPLQQQTTLTGGSPVPLQQQTAQTVGFPVPLQQQTAQNSGFLVPLQQQTAQNSGFLVPLQQQTTLTRGFPVPLQQQTTSAFHLNETTGHTQINSSVPQQTEAVENLLSSSLPMQQNEMATGVSPPALDVVASTLKNEDI